MQKIRTAVVGAGFIGPVHVEALIRVGAQVTGILGVSREESERAAQMLGLPKAYRDFDEIPGLPAHKANLGLQYRTKSGLSAAVYAQAVSSQKVVYNDNALYNTDLRIRTQEGFARFDFEAKLPVGKAFEAGLFVRNILDASYQERFGFPAAGRNFGLSLRAAF